MVGGGAGLLKGLLKAGAGDLLGATVGKADVAGFAVSFVSPGNKSVGWQVQDSGFHRDAADGEVVVAGEYHLRINFGRVHTCEIADVGIAEVGKTGRSGGAVV